MRLVAATNNKKKLEEIKRILQPMGFEVCSLSQIGLCVEAEENADSFEGNARLKARAVFEACHLPTVADDSGLCVDALDGAPGVYSARFGGPELDDAGRNALLLKKMRDVPADRRGAAFVSAVCLYLADGTLLECRGECRGEIAFTPSGQGGFGYDPLFLVDGRSYSALSAEEKDAVSHRGRALRVLRDKLCSHLRLQQQEEE
jgi:XTP/dITP diphosphohydrolase